jgi:hypothetical protein
MLFQLPGEKNFLEKIAYLLRNLFIYLLTGLTK